MTVIYHNPACGTSRNTLALLRAAGTDPEVIDYLKTPPSRAVIEDLVGRSGLSLRAALRRKGTPFSDLGLDDPALSRDDLLDAVIAHPILLNRPFVVTGKGVKLCRPSDVVADLLPALPSGEILKEEGVPFLLDQPVAADDGGLRAALLAADLPVADLDGSTGQFYSYRTLGGAEVGYGGFEPVGSDILLRSVVVLPAARGRGIGGNLVALLLRRAFDLGAARALLLTTSAGPFFTAIGFKALARDLAPAALVATRQFTETCPSHAGVFSRAITL